MCFVPEAEKKGDHQHTPRYTLYSTLFTMNSNHFPPPGYTGINPALHPPEKNRLSFEYQSRTIIVLCKSALLRDIW